MHNPASLPLPLFPGGPYTFISSKPSAPPTGNPPAAVHAARNKHLTRAVMSQAGLPAPRSFLVNNRDDVAEAAAHVGFPAVLKPVSGAASVGVQRVDGLQHLLVAYDQVILCLT